MHSAWFSNLTGTDFCNLDKSGNGNAVNGFPGFPIKPPPTLGKSYSSKANVGDKETEKRKLKQYCSCKGNNNQESSKNIDDMQ